MSQGLSCTFHLLAGGSGRTFPPDGPTVSMYDYSPDPPAHFDGVGGVPTRFPESINEDNYRKLKKTVI